MGNEVGERVKSVRGGLNQRDFAERLGVSKASISQIEQGKAMPSGDFLLRIHQAFGVDITWLLVGMGSAPVAPVEQLTMREKHLLANYRGSDDMGKRAVETTASAVANRDSGQQARSGK